MQNNLILKEMYEITKENKPDFQLLRASLGKQRQALSLETLSSMARINPALLLTNTLFAVIHLSGKGQGILLFRRSQNFSLSKNLCVRVTGGGSDSVCDTRLFKINYVPVLCCQYNYK